MMDNGNMINSADVVFTIDGKAIGELQTVALKPKEIEIKNYDSMSLFNKDFTLTMRDVKVNPEFIGKMFPENKMFTVVVVGYNLPRGNRLPKKKRLRKKWMKKYRKEFKLEDCIIV